MHVPSRSSISMDEEAISIARSLSKQGIQTVGVSVLIKNTDEDLEKQKRLHQSQAKKGVSYFY